MPLRELCLILIVVSICIVGLWRPKVALYGYIWYAITAPDVIAFCEGKYPFSIGLATITLIGSVRYMRRIGVILRIPLVRWLLALQIPIGLSIIFCQGPFLSQDRYIQFELNTLMALIIPLMLETPRDLCTFLGVCGVSEGLLGSRIGLYGIINGGGMLNFGHGNVYDSNELALAIVMLLPICWYVRNLVESRWLKWLMLSIMLTAAPAVIMSNSRGASLALGVMLIFVFLHSDRKLGFAVVATLAIAPAIYMVQDQYFNRMKTIENPEDEESAATRLVLWNVAVDMWKDHPILGVGFGNRNFARLASQYLKRENFTVAHNSYLQMLVDSGIFAFLIFLRLLFGTMIWLSTTAKRLRSEYPPGEYISLAIQAPLLAYAVGGAFYSQQRYDFFYILVMAAAAWHSCVRSGDFADLQADTAPAEQESEVSKERCYARNGDTFFAMP